MIFGTWSTQIPLPSARGFSWAYTILIRSLGIVGVPLLNVETWIATSAIGICALVEIRQVLFEVLGRVSLGIDRDE